MKPEAEEALLRSLNEQTNALYTRTAALEKAVKEMEGFGDMLKRGEYIRDVVIEDMNALRAAGDALEGLVAKSYWPMPTYHDLLTSV